MAEITHHTTASSPRPHILYNVKVTRDGVDHNVLRRYSDFITLHEVLQDPYKLPPKRIITTTFVPSAWADDALITERKVGLSKYIGALLQDGSFKAHRSVINFLHLASRDQSSTDYAHPEDCLPSTFSRKDALAMKAALLEGTDKDSEATKQDAEATATTPIAAAYYPDWSSKSPESLDFSKFDILFYAFATPSSSAGLTLSSGSLLKRLVTAAKNSGKGTKVVLSVGGWGGCKYYSFSCSTSANRTKFVAALKSAVNTYSLDGVDLDWEYPNSTGAGNGQGHSSADAANFLSMIQALRTSLGSSKIISSAVTQETWLGSNGKPLTDVSKYAAVMTYVNIMNYDVWGSSSNPGPNAPLGDLCGTSGQPHASAQASLKQWKAAGFPANKILLGLPLYGYASKSTKTSLTGSFAPGVAAAAATNGQTDVAAEETTGEDDGSAPDPQLIPPHGNSKPRILPGEELNKAAAGDLSAFWGQQIAFNQLISAGALVKKSDGTYGGANGYTYAWDDCSDTPFLFNKSRTTVVTYDDTYSLADKAKFAKQNGMAGCFTWSLDQDDGTTLQKVIRTALGR